MSNPTINRIRVLILAAVVVGLISNEVVANEPTDGPEQVIRELYELVTFPGSEPPDWDVARAMFIDEAVVVLRTSRETNTTFSVEGWIDDFVTFIDNSTAKETGFSETILSMHTVAMGDVANVWVLYESKLAERPAREGVDNFSLIRRDGEWKIVSIVNELPRWGFSVPDVLRE
jgi:hypothetical protein